MKKSEFVLSILAVGLALGTAWAIRGKFGHEQGAAWAGAIGALSLVLVAKRKDWFAKAFKIAMAAAVGWGISGVMSYGLIVGYGKGTDFPNVFYGLLMLFVLGVLYGFIGGGLFGLALVDSKSTRVKWHALLVEMVALGLLTYVIIISQLEWLMTPPRSEMWAACLGASIALAWYLSRRQHKNVMSVATWSAVGAGFGFAFGNFLQVMGTVSQLEFNFWNVMEYSIGFFGGAGMAYGTFTSSWPEGEDDSSRRANVIPIVFVALFIPFVVWEQSFVSDRFDFLLEAGKTDSTVFLFKLMAITAIIAVGVVTLARNHSSAAISETGDRSPVVKQFFVLYTVLYIFLSFLVTGLFVHPVEQYLYLVNLVVVLFLISAKGSAGHVYESKPRAWLVAAIISISIVALLAVIAVNSHSELPGSQIRFGGKL
jgi:hypothetical protein